MALTSLIIHACHAATLKRPFSYILTLLHLFLTESCQCWRTSGIRQFGEPRQAGDRSPHLGSMQKTFQKLHVLVAMSAWEGRNSQFAIYPLCQCRLQHISLIYRWIRRMSWWVYSSQSVKLITWRFFNKEKENFLTGLRLLKLRDLHSCVSTPSANNCSFFTPLADHPPPVGHKSLWNMNTVSLLGQCLLVDDEFSLHYLACHRYVCRLGILP